MHGQPLVLIIGLTGSIGMGKSTTARMFRDAGIPVNDADTTVHALYAGVAAPLIEAAFPGTTHAGEVDRDRLSERVLGDAAALRLLEQLVHPLVREQRKAFIATHELRGAMVSVLDIPLLFESGSEAEVDLIAVVTAAAFVQKERVLARPGMTAARFERILRQQMPDDQKRRRAHVVIDTDQGLAAARRQVDELLRACAGMRGRSDHA